LFLENEKANDVNGFINIGMNMKGLHGNGLISFLKNRKANDVNSFIYINMTMKGLYRNGLD
jgi:hypothetical protein